MDLKSFTDILEENAVEFEVHGKDIYTYCRKCNHHNKKLAIDPVKGVFQCFVCNHKGTVTSYLKEIGLESTEIGLESNTGVGDVGLQAYFTKRGISDLNVLRRGRVSYQSFPEAILFNYKGLSEDGYTGEAIKTKFLDPEAKPKYLHKATEGSPKYYIPDLELFKLSPNVVVCEGEIDALTWSNFGIASLATTGLQKRDSVKDLGRFKTVYINFDNESDPKVKRQVNEAIKAYTRELRQLYPEIEIKLIKMPSLVKDANEMLQSGYGEQDFRNLISLAEDYLEGTIARSSNFYLTEMKEYLTDKSKAQGMPTLIEGLDEALGGGERLGEIDALVAEAKTGKSSFYHQKIYQRVEAGVPVGYISRELSPASEVLPNLFSIHFGVNFWKLDKLSEEEQSRLMQEASSVSGSWPLYFTNGYGNISMDDIAQFIRECKSKGVNYFYLDHFHYCLENSEDNKEISKFARELKALVKEENIHLNLIVQPTKINPEFNKLSYKNMRGSVAIEQAIDSAFIFYRVPDMPNISCVELEACRHKLSKKGKKIYLEYDPETTRMTEVKLESAPIVRMNTAGADYSIE